MCSDDLKESSILIVEDSEANIRFLERLLAKSGYQHVVGVRDPRKALDAFIGLRPDLVILDLHMPHLDGFQVMEALQPHVPENGFLPILVITGDRDPSVRIRCLGAGAKDFVEKPFRSDEVLLRIKNLLETRHIHRFLETRNETLELQVVEEHSKVQETQLEVLRRLAVAAECRDDITGRHAERVGILAALIGEALGRTKAEVALLEAAAPLHDVGKIGIPDSILLKPGKLTEEEFETMKGHTTIGGLILSRGSFPLLKYAREIALSHHEWWDGSGYPNGLAGEEIPLSGRIVAVADVFDSIIHERTYKPSIPVDECLEIMIRKRGRHFDPRLLDLFLSLVHSGHVRDALSSVDSRTPSESNISWGSSSALTPPVTADPETAALGHLRVG